MTDQPERGEMKQRVWKAKQMQLSRDFDAFMKANEIAECSACKGTGYVAAEPAQPTPILPPFDDPAWDEAVAQRTEQIFGKRQPAPQDAEQPQQSFATIVRQTLEPIKDLVADEIYRETFIRVLAVYTSAKALNRAPQDAPPEMSITDHLGMIESWVKRDAPDWMKEKAILVHVNFIREALVKEKQTNG